MGLRDFLKKILDFFDAEEERNLPGNYGRSNTQLRTGCEQKGTLFEKYLISRVDTANYFGVLTGHGIFVRMGGIRNQIAIRTF